MKLKLPAKFRIVCHYGFLLALPFYAGFGVSAPNTSDYTAAPPFVGNDAGKPNVVIALDISGSMKAVAYADVDAGNWRNANTINNDFNPDKLYYGYFDSAKKYAYSANALKQFFYASDLGNWDGNFLNWLTMRRMDIVRKVLVGGKVRDRDGELIDSETWYVIEGQNENVDYDFRKTYSASSGLSPFPDDTVFKIINGQITTVNDTGAGVVPLSATVEIGQITIERDTTLDDEGNELSNWHPVAFSNTYIDPAVVVTGLSHKSNEPTHARVRNITPTGFEVRLEEWDYLDINHIPEKVTYIVAETSLGGANAVSVDGVTYQVRAGKTTTPNSVPGGTGPTPVNLFSTYTPVVFTGISTMDIPNAMIARPGNVTGTGFEIAAQAEKAAGVVAGPHNVHWIAFEPFSGIVDYPIPGAGAAIEIGDSGGNTVGKAFFAITFDTPFSKAPILAVMSQTINEIDPAHPRYRQLKAESFQVKMEEEGSTGGTQHAKEQIGYIAVQSRPAYNIKLAVLEEPIGVVQQNSGSLRFGLAVYNYDHEQDPAEIYRSNLVHGGTFRPCYPDTNIELDGDGDGGRNNYNICLDTHVKAPINNIIDVIEDHPLIWGTTPIAETLYEIKSYFAQVDHNRNSHTQWYDNGTENSVGNADDGTPKARNSYEVSNEWDPYYYDELGTTLPCAKSFVLHFNDGAPFNDWDGDASEHPTVANDGIGKFEKNHVLDDLALEMREIDCRTDAGMTGHQDIISYYVYAALGEEEANNNNTTKMREAAANGGFVDGDGDYYPDPPHPENFQGYMNATSCQANEWDADGDCNPDNFYFANDGAVLVTELNAAFNSIVARAATGGASSVISAARSGEGNVVNAIFRPSAAGGGTSAKWVGDVHAMLIDSEGKLREDDGDKVLEDPGSDPYLDMCSDANETVVRVKKSNTQASRPTAAQTANCAGGVFPLGLFDINYLWSGGAWLSGLTDLEVTGQRSYTAPSNGRHIITGIDEDGDGIVTNSEQADFVIGSFPQEYAGALATDLTSAENVINYIRGADIAGYRSRQLNGQTMRLGDIVYSTPTSVGRPSENLDLLYESNSYKTFLTHYKDRRTVVYAGANDGMLHAFNAGWYDASLKKFFGAKGGGAPGSSINFELGAELWAYVPFNALPHLDYLMDPKYGATPGNHVYFVDQKPRIFDAKVFDPDTDHPGGWGTIMVVGMRLGGGETTVDIDLGTGTPDDRTLVSSYSIFDITNPDLPPKLLIEYTHPDLGFTTSNPTPVVIGSNSEGDGDWYLMLGSGPDTDAVGFDEVKSTQNARLFLMNLKSVTSGSASVLYTNFGTNGILTLSDPNSFISDLTAVDYGLDSFTTDAVYFGTVSGDNTGWGGKIYRISIQANTNAPSAQPASWTPTLVHDPGKPVTSPVSVGVDSQLNRWLYVGTGRYYTAADNLDNSTNYYYGLKEPRDASGALTVETIGTTKLADITNVKVLVNTGVLDPAPTLTPALAAQSTVQSLEARMRISNKNATGFLDGWRRTLGNGKRNIGSAALLGGTLSYTTYFPEFDECSMLGDSSLYVVNALTGTADDHAILYQADDDTHYEYVVDIGSAPALSPSLHRGEGYATDNDSTALMQSADGSIISVQQDNSEKVRDGEASWRQLQ